MPLTEERSGRRFHLLSRIGSGSYGEVFLAELESAGGFRRQVAIKLLHPELTRSDLTRKLRDEARILGRLSHRHIVGVLDLTRFGDRWAVIMDYVPGADLDQIVRYAAAHRTHVPPRAALEIGVAVLTALDAARTTGDGAGGQLEVVHRDIKPNNVRVTPDGDVKVLDFGVARMGSTADGVPDGAWVGTDRYLAPERVLRASEGPEGDVYAASMTLVEVLLGRALDGTPVATDLHSAQVERTLNEVRATVPGPRELVERAIEALARGLAAVPAERPPAGPLAAELARVAERWPGEGLASFARRVVPSVAAEAGPASAVVGVWSEGELYPPSPTIVSPEADDTPAPAPPRSARPAVVPVVALAAVSLGAGALAVTALLALGFVIGPAPSEPTAALAPASGPPPAASAPPRDPEPAASAEPAASEPIPAPPPTSPAPQRSEGGLRAPGTPWERAARAETASRTAAPRRAPVEPPVPAAPRDDPGPLVPRALVAATFASAIEVVCGQVRGAGTSSAVIRNFPAGRCEVTVSVGDRASTTTVSIDRAREVRCSVASGQLTCS